MALTQAYPSTQFPATGQLSTLPDILDLLLRLQASLRPSEQQSTVIKNFDAVKIQYLPAPTKSEALASVKATLAANPAGLSAQQTTDLLIMLQSVTASP